MTHALMYFVICKNWGSYKTRNGTERNGTEPEVIDSQYGRGRRIRDVLVCQLIKVRELI